MRDVQVLFEAGAAGIKRPKAIRFKHGVLSPGAYINNRVLPSHPHEWDEVIERLKECAVRLMPDYDVIASVATGGVPHGVALAREMGVPHYTVKKREKDHGLGGLIDGDVPALESKRVLLVEDMSSTFMSSIRAMQPLEAEGAVVTHTLLLNTWGLPEFHKNVGAHSVHAICTGQMIVDYAAQSGKLDRGLEATVRHWLRYPEDEEWSKDSGWVLPKQAGE